MKRSSLGAVRAATVAHLAISSCLLVSCGNVGDAALEEGADAPREAAPARVIRGAEQPDRMVLALLDSTPLEDLLDPARVGLLPEEVAEIEAAMHGDDGVPGTQDDARLEDIASLRALEHGASIEHKLGAWAGAMGYLEPGATVSIHESAMEPIDCAQLTEEEKAHAAESGLCQPLADLTTASVATGSCGTSRFYIYRGGQSGQAQFGMGLNAVDGLISNVKYSIPWRNETTNRRRWVFGSDRPWSTGWAAVRDVNTGSGRVCAKLTGVAWVGVSVLPCRILHPDDCSDVP